jgi:hypothetical protein
MDNTKDLIKEHLAKIVAEEICKNENILNQLKEEVLKDLLPATPTINNVVEEKIKEQESSNEIQNPTNDLTGSKKDKSPFDSLKETQSLLDSINEDLKKLHKEQSKKELNFKFNPDGLPAWYKLKDRTKNPARAIDLNFDFPKFKGFQEQNDIPLMRDLFSTQPSFNSFEIPKQNKEMPVKDIINNISLEHIENKVEKIKNTRTGSVKNKVDKKRVKKK